MILLYLNLFGCGNSSIAIPFFYKHTTLFMKIQFRLLKLTKS